MKKNLIFNLLELIILIKIQFSNEKKVLNNYGIWESNMNEILIDEQAANITTKVSKNQNVLGSDIGIDEKINPSINKQNYLKSTSNTYSSFAKIDQRNNNLNTGTSHSNCECFVYGSTCWAKSKCIGIASTISIVTLFLFISLMWFMQIISGYAAKEEYIILRNEIIKKKQDKN
ncbi:hypothetical protein FG386_003132 [Cryptosporidium ryanae]|uniref:uncharacterized protein n=1 Tax=Cryptosporidium ryanae TaxID=515981 RepID=UPI00351A0A26|nr:hypothetical protein FG386_003132 [Cryptosporidium ryanae]